MCLRSSIVVLALVVSSCGSSVRTTFEPVYRAGKTLESAVGSGVTYPKFIELLQAFHTELSIAGDRKPTGRARAILDHYAEAAVIYDDSLTLWRQHVHQGRMGADAAAALKTKYWLTESLMDSTDGVQSIWNSAALPLGIANSMYLGTS